MVLRVGRWGHEQSALNKWRGGAASAVAGRLPVGGVLVTVADRAAVPSSWLAITGRGLRGRLALPLCVGWLASVLLLDGAGGVPVRVWLFGSGWLLLALLLRGRTTEERWQCTAVLAYALLVELVFSAWLGTYVYRMGPVAPYVTPGHGVIFLTALALSQEPVLRRRARGIAVGTAAAGLPLAVVGLLGERHDVLGLAWAACFVYFALRGSRPLLYAATFWIALALEHAGVGLGAWSWATHDQILGVVPMGDPPSVPGGGYVWLDAAGLWLGAAVARRVRSSGWKRR